MIIAEAFQRIEEANQFCYPLAFWMRFEEFASLIETTWFQTEYPGVRLVVTHENVLALRQADPDLPVDLIPFMIVAGQQFPDYYGFQVSRRTAEENIELPVMVWCLHAYVHCWDAGFGAFLNELQSQYAVQSM